MIEPSKLKPFKRFCMTIGELPSSYMESMTYYEMLEWLCNYLEKTVIPAVNNNANALTELQNYVNNYFENLDVQNEINNKLDEMAESGELAEIIAQYLQLAGVIAFDKISDMVSAQNITNGSICRTLGESNYLDGKGAFYKIRTITNNDTVDGETIIALNVSNTLIAEKIPDYNINRLNSEITSINNRIDNLNHKKYVFIGDSYNTNDTPSGGTQITPWSSLLVNYLGLSSSDYYSSGVSGAGWSVEGNKFITQLENLSSTITNKESITDIYVLGGINDNPNSPSDVYNEIINFSNYVATNYPNAIITIGIISWSTYLASKINLLKKIAYYNNASSKVNVRYISNAYTWYHVYNQYQSDGHPTLEGSQTIAFNLANYIKGGIANENVYYEGSIYRDQNNLGISTSQETIGTIKQFLNNETVNLMISLDILSLSNNTTSPSITTPYILGSFDNLFIRTTESPLCVYSGSCWGYDTTSSKYVNMTYSLLIDGINLKIMFYYVDPSSGNVSFNFSTLVFDKIPILNIPKAFC